MFAAFLACAGLAAAAAAAPMKFDIPAQSAADALIAFSKQSGCDVLYSFNDLQAVRSHAVAGDYEPDDALALLLTDTGFAATRNGGKFVVTKTKANSGAVRGALTLPSGDAAAGVTVTVWETAQTATTDRSGEFFFNAIAPGTYRLVAQADGYQPLHITDVTVRAGRDLTLSRLQLRAADEVTKLQPVVVQGESVEKLDPYAVEGRRVQPFSTANVDLSRTIDDIQPYYIFDSRTIERSGAVNAEAFLKQNLTMNATKSTNAANATSYGANSEVNLRGLGADRTLILVNGRRLPSAVFLSSTYQPDINGIPVDQIDHIEVLPTSASGIYGASALGGVINIVLKRNYSGGSVSATYGSTFDTDAHQRSVALSWGTVLEDGRTRVRFASQLSDGTSLSLIDRRSIVEGNIRRALANDPSNFYTLSRPFAGATTNIANSTAANLVLKDGRALGSRITHVNAGTAAGVSGSDLGTSLVANAGTYNTDLSTFKSLQLGLGSLYGYTPELKTYSVSISRDFTPWLELFADASYNDNTAKGVNNSWSSNSSATIAATAPTNPFTTAVVVKFPAQLADPRIGRFLTRALTFGAKIKLPADWIAQLDYSWAETASKLTYSTINTTAFRADLNSGAVNPFVDTQLYPISLEKYRIRYFFDHGSTLNDVAFRASGPLGTLPWGRPTLTTGLETRLTGSYDGHFSNTGATTIQTYYGLKQNADSGYVELQAPLVPRNRFPGLYALDFQAAGRTEFFRVATGTPTQTLDTATGAITYGWPTTADGKPIRSHQSYNSTNGTVGFKYQPIESVTLRASYGTAFQPPTAAQLQKNPVPSDFPTTITDPKTGDTYDVATLDGGNPNLSPQSAKSYNVGVIWEPKSVAVLRGLRVDWEWSKIEQQNAIGTLSAQQIVNDPATYGGRITRDASGLITLVDTSSLNLFARDLQTWDLSLSYRWDTAALGSFEFSGTESYVISTKTQFAIDQPFYQGVGYPSDTDEGAALRYRTTLKLNWDFGNWNAGLTSRIFASYYAYGAAGGPISLLYDDGEDDGNYVKLQGSRTIPSQHYEDLTLGYRFDRPGSDARLASRWLRGVSIQAGVTNLFDKVPPYDTSPDAWLGYLSSFGDPRGREYWVTVRKSF